MQKIITARIAWRPISGSAPSKPLSLIQSHDSDCDDTAFGSAPSKRLQEVAKSHALRIAWRPISGSSPLKLLFPMLKYVTSRIAWRPISGSAPSKQL
eukprot:1222070-Amphidinium_carterae.1